MTTKNDVLILNQIKKCGGINKLKSISIMTLVKCTGLSHTKIRGTIRVLLSDGYILDGLMQKNAKTYYITTKGLEVLNELIGGNSDE